MILLTETRIMNQDLSLNIKIDMIRLNENTLYRLNSLNKRKIFGPIVLTPEAVRPAGHKWIFVRKRNEKNEVVRYKA